MMERLAVLLRYLVVNFELPCRIRSDTRSLSNFVEQYEVAAPHGLPLPKVSKRAQATGRWRDVSVDWVELHGGSTYTFRGTYIPGSGKLTGTYDIMNTKEQGAFEYQIAEVHIMNPTKPGALPHDYLKLLPSLMDSHQYAEVAGALTAGFYIAEGKTVNSVTGKDTASPSLLLNLRDDGSLSGFAEVRTTACCLFALL